MADQGEEGTSHTQSLPVDAVRPERSKIAEGRTTLLAPVAESSEEAPGRDDDGRRVEEPGVGDQRGSRQPSVLRAVLLPPQDSDEQAACNCMLRRPPGALRAV